MSREVESSAGRPRIQRLPDALIDRIAAGEVVERPASVVKELVENALDAGARRVRVEAREGGRALVAVTDDGCGMTAAEAQLALERHATSKIRSAEDLARIRTLGFRGEALPAIASVSSLRLRSRTPDSEEGVELRVEGGRLVSVASAGCPAGTRVEVARLFATVPARRKFLKRPSTEWRHIADWLARMALAHPELHIEAVHDGRTAANWPPVTDPVERIAAVLSEPEAAALVPLEALRERICLHGFVSHPEVHRPTAAAIHLFVNGRPVRDRLLRHALLESLRDVLPRGRYPTALLFVELPPEEVDVNVHPAKWEVRFREPGRIHEAVREAVRRALGERRWLGGARATPSRAQREDRGADAPSAAALSSGWWIGPDPVPGALPLVAREGPAGGLRASASPPAAHPRLESARKGPGLRLSELPLLGQVLAGYLVLEGEEGLVLVDQHAAHERVLFERLRESWREGGGSSQGLLVAEPVEVDAGEESQLEAFADLLARLGFELEPFGPGIVLVRAIPAPLAGHSVRALVRELFDRLGEEERAGAGREPSVGVLERLFASLACHAARRQGERLEPEEQRALLAELDAIPWAPTCPHGRPVATLLGRAEIERRFARR